ncbi:carboxymuconolactone decarboxylase family protein [Algoriphagus sp. D3-2-R+10]|uniref:carboxymuconolactone decarboxylase family protein n=1 Tax=Algoriphagus aurantiacus TaxID=3103948 RepID=UPI002B3E4191|nr:carboxymuconolactone decarboxylase family protein [Algoriphagus sp. D3-2-R+10]MEB2775392.1 carboxymuconolactone decarboxylase family protein [Algoriphagus sp. D3-2-R+10]
MKTRITLQEINPIIYESLTSIDQYAKSVLDPKLCELIKFRVSQINSCAYCLDMHHKEAISMGEEEMRLHALPAWRECPYYSDSERAALEFAEAITEPGKYGLSDEIYSELARYFDKEMIMALTVLVLHINGWNRINHVLRPVPGKYRVGQFNI